MLASSELPANVFCRESSTGVSSMASKSRAAFSFFKAPFRAAGLAAVIFRGVRRFRLVELVKSDTFIPSPLADCLASDHHASDHLQVGVERSGGFDRLQNRDHVARGRAHVLQAADQVVDR